MADIFISYSGEDKTNVKVIAEILEQNGWSVWWDRQIPIGKQYDTVIEEELAKAWCVIVIWTQRSVTSEWVKNEASEAAQSGKLVPVLLDNVALPLAFKRTETAMLTGWNGEPDHPELSLLFDAISQTIEKNKANREAGGGLPAAEEKEKKKEITRKVKDIFSNQSSPSVYMGIAIIGFLVSITAVYYYLQFIKGNVSSQVDQRVFYLVLILFGIAASAVVFGLMNSYAVIKGEKYKTSFRLAGPVAGVVLTVLGGFYLPQGSGEKIVTIRVFDHKKNPIAGGDVKIYLQDYIRTQSIDKMGQAQFAGIPGNGLKDKIKIEVTSPGYLMRQFDTTLNRSGTLELTLPLTTVVLISGSVKTAAEMPIREVEINVDGTRYFTRSITDGSYNLRLEEYTLGDEITMTTSHEGYEDKTMSLKIDAPNMKNINFFLQPVNH